MLLCKTKNSIIVSENQKLSFIIMLDSLVNDCNNFYLSPQAILIFSSIGVLYVNYYVVRLILFFIYIFSYLFDIFIYKILIFLFI